MPSVLAAAAWSAAFVLAQTGNSHFPLHGPDRAFTPDRVRVALKPPAPAPPANGLAGPMVELAKQALANPALRNIMRDAAEELAKSGADPSQPLPANLMKDVLKRLQEDKAARAALEDLFKKSASSETPGPKSPEPRGANGNAPDLSGLGGLAEQLAQDPKLKDLIERQAEQLGGQPNLSPAEAARKAAENLAADPALRKQLEAGLKSLPSGAPRELRRRAAEAAGPGASNRAVARAETKAASEALGQAAARKAATDANVGGPPDNGTPGRGNPGAGSADQGMLSELLKSVREQLGQPGGEPAGAPDASGGAANGGLPDRAPQPNPAGAPERTGDAQPRAESPPEANARPPAPWLQPNNPQGNDAGNPAKPTDANAAGGTPDVPIPSLPTPPSPEGLAERMAENAGAFGEWSARLGQALAEKLPAPTFGGSSWGGDSFAALAGMAPDPARAAAALPAVALVAALAFGAWLLLRTRAAIVQQAAWRAARRPPAVAGLDARAQAQALFDHAAWCALGDAALPRNHRAVAPGIAPAAAEELAGLYEAARYAPPHEPFDDAAAARVRELTRGAAGS